jgi:hypothetical protein
MFYNDSNELREGPVVVRRPVYDAGMKLEAEVKAGASGPAFENARLKVHECHAAGDEDGKKWWEEVFNFLMWSECVSAGTETIILEDGETWDDEEEKVIRADTNQPRSDTENR